MHLEEWEAEGVFGTCQPLTYRGLLIALYFLWEIIPSTAFKSCTLSELTPPRSQGLNLCLLN